MRHLAIALASMTLLGLSACAPRPVERLQRPATERTASSALAPPQRPEVVAAATGASGASGATDATDAKDASDASGATSATSATGGTGAPRLDTTEPSPEPSPSGGTKLAVEVRNAADAPPRTATLECGATPVASGFITDAAAACAAVAAQREFLLHPPTDRACTMVYGGSQRGEIRGTVDGQPVRVSVGRTNGCSISDWAALTAVLGTPQGEP